MTILKCSAVKCVYNKEELCSKGGIDVVGENATSANETSCGSFQERQEGSVATSITNGCGGTESVKKRDMSSKGMSLSLLRSVISMICSPETYLFLKKSGIWMSFF